LRLWFLLSAGRALGASSAADASCPASAPREALAARVSRAAWDAARQAGGVALLGGVFFALDIAFWNQGLLYTSATNATLMTNTAPLWVGLGAWFLLRERPTPWFWLSLWAPVQVSASNLELAICSR
jgi:drug/metabolite transporter (DMT)-like permease